MPRNVKERAMAVVVLVFALIIFGSFISSLTACVTKLRDMSIDTSRQFSLLRRFLNSSGLPPDLKVRIRKFLELQMYSETQTMSEKDVKVLKLLSQPLTTELTYHRMRPTLTRCPLLLLLDYQCKATSRHIAMNACKEIQVAAGDLVFTPGEDAQQMMILSRGKLKYVESRSQEVRMLRRGARVAELALLYQWTFRGSGIALTSVDMITINAPAFIRSVMQFSQAHDLTLRFGRMFLEKVKKHPENLTLFGDVLDAVPLMETMFSELCGENADLGVGDRTSFWSPTGDRRTVAQQDVRPEPTTFEKLKAMIFGTTEATAPAGG